MILSDFPKEKLEKMSEKLVIHNFGPIRNAQVEVRDLTVFVGPQATGKSLTAQILYFLRGLADLDVPSDQDPEVIVLSALVDWLGNHTSVYTKTGSELRLEVGKDILELQWRHAPIVNETIIKRVTRQSEIEKIGPPTQIYIPAGRILYSFIPPYSRTYLRLAQNWPGYIQSFYETLGTAIREQLRNAGQITLFDDQFVRSHIESILKGKIRYGFDTVVLEVGETRLDSTTIAAGQMELWPFWAIIENRALHNTLLFFEEPEAHLHPGAQKVLMEVIAHLVNQGTKFVITTHSPYILYAINNFLMAQQVLDANYALPDGISGETALRPKQVAAYRFTPEGHVENIMDMEVGLIDEEELNRTANELGSDFTRLQERLGGYE